MSESDKFEEIVKQATLSKFYTAIPTVPEEASESTNSSRRVLVVVSVSMDDKRSPRWKTVCFRVCFRMCSITVFVFSTSVFAAVSLLALPMALMALMVIIGAGYFSRVIIQGMVLVMCQERPIMHLIAENRETANRMMAMILQLQPEDTSSSYVFEVDGKLWTQQACVKLVKRWKRRLCGTLSDAHLL